MSERDDIETGDDFDLDAIDADEANDDGACEHGIAADVHCCECGRSGFFPPDDCACYHIYDRDRDEDDGLTYADPRDERDDRRNDD